MVVENGTPCVNTALDNADRHIMRLAAWAQAKARAAALAAACVAPENDPALTSNRNGEPSGHVVWQLCGALKNGAIGGVRLEPTGGATSLAKATHSKSHQTVPNGGGTE